MWFLFLGSVPTPTHSSSPLVSPLTLCLYGTHHLHPTGQRQWWGDVGWGYTSSMLNSLFDGHRSRMNYFFSCQGASMGISQIHTKCHNAQNHTGHSSFKYWLTIFLILDLLTWFYWTNWNESIKELVLKKKGEDRGNEIKDHARGRRIRRKGRVKSKVWRCAELTSSQAMCCRVRQRKDEEQLVDFVESCWATLRF